MNEKIIYGIQQVGVGVSNAYEAFRWYASRLGANVPVFEDNNTATYMAPYMGGKAHDKRAILAMNMNGGSGYEIWQYLDRTPEKPKETIKVGDLGIHTAFIKTRDIEKAKDLIERSGYRWKFLHYGNQVNIINEYDIRAYPTYYLIDREGKLVMSPAPTPNDQFEGRLFKVLRADGVL